jgi:hypothetical protein
VTFFYRLSETFALHKISLINANTKERERERAMIVRLYVEGEIPNISIFHTNLFFFCFFFFF